MPRKELVSIICWHGTGFDPGTDLFNLESATPTIRPLAIFFLIFVFLPFLPHNCAILPQLFRDKGYNESIYQQFEMVIAFCVIRADYCELDNWV